MILVKFELDVAQACLEYDGIHVKVRVDAIKLAPQDLPQDPRLVPSTSGATLASHTWPRSRDYSSYLLVQCLSLSRKCLGVQ